MPLYHVEHSYPLSQTQKHAIASQITALHSTTFTTPSLFVNVYFTDCEAPGNYYLAGEPTPVSPNRIFATVRTSPKRTKEVFDAAALKVQNIWYDVVNGTTGANGHASNGPTGTKEERSAKKLHFMVYTPMLAAQENGVTIPSANEEGTWLKDNMAYFKEQAEVHGDEQFRGMLKEVHERPDLRKLLD